MNILRAPFLRVQRQFPYDQKNLVLEINRTYTDIANAMNDRTIGIHPTNGAILSGDSFTFSNQKQEVLRQVYQFTTTAPITHNIKNIQPGQFADSWGQWTDGTNSYGLIFASSVAIPGQLTFYCTSTQIIFLAGAGAPALSTTIPSYIVLQWLSAP